MISLNDIVYDNYFAYIPKTGRNTEKEKHQSAK